METDTYADSSFLVSLYRNDANRRVADQFMARHRPLLAFSALNRIELRNGLRNARSCGEISEDECRAAFRQIEHDLDEALLIHVAVEWTRIFRRENHAGHDGQRTLDLLHVAIALESGANIFLSFDRRQRRLAQAAGLKVKP